MFELERIDHVAITVSDIENSIKWYKEVLGLERYYDGAWDGVPVMMGKGGTCIALFKVREEQATHVDKVRPACGTGRQAEACPTGGAMENAGYAASCFQSRQEEFC